MKILNCGSLNIDRVFQVNDLVRPGETIPANGMELHAGGKGLNQSLALARAGAEVAHLGAVGQDGVFLKELLAADGVDTAFVAVNSHTLSGQAVIQVTNSGENAIVLYPGSNHTLDAGRSAAAMKLMQPGDMLLLQNETNNVAQMIEQGAQYGLKIFFNPAPMTDEVKKYPLELVDTLIVNETEAAGLAGCSGSADCVLKLLRKMLPSCNLLLTLGSKGSLWAGGDGRIISAEACSIAPAVDTTAAGDTFTGYFMAALARQKSVEIALLEASIAAGWCVAHHGAAPSIPYFKDIQKFSDPK